MFCRRWFMGNWSNLPFLKLLFNCQDSLHLFLIRAHSLDHSVKAAPPMQPHLPLSLVWPLPQVKYRLKILIIMQHFLYFKDTSPQPKSVQQLVDCTKGFSRGNGTELLRTNDGCAVGFADLHGLWLNATQSPYQNAEVYPLRPEDGECVNFGYGPDYFNYIVKRQVRERWNMRKRDTKVIL